MATEQHVFDIGFCKAENDLSAKQYYFVELSALDQVDVADAAADVVIGVLQNDPKAGEAAQVRVLGISKVVSDGSGTAIAVGDRIGTNASGKAVKKATADFGVSGIALDASSADGTIIRTLLTPVNTFRTLGG